jgi:hypothetical protein
MQKAVFDYLRFIQALLGIAILINGLASGQTNGSLTDYILADTWVYLGHSILAIVAGVLHFVSLVLGIKKPNRRMFSLILDSVLGLLIFVTSSIQASHLPRITRDINDDKAVAKNEMERNRLSSLSIQFIVSVVLGTISTSRSSLIIRIYIL